MAQDKPQFHLEFPLLLLVPVEAESAEEAQQILNGMTIEQAWKQHTFHIIREGVRVVDAPLPEQPSPDALTFADVAQYFPHDETAAAEAFGQLERWQWQDLANTYLPAGWVAAAHRRFNVWLGHQLAPPSGERLTLADWCARWYAEYQQRNETEKGGDQ